jgi:hypothetical protein
MSAEMAVSGRAARPLRHHLAQFQHAVANIAILGQMTGGGTFSVRGNRLVKGMTVKKLRIQFFAEFTRTTGSNLESFADGWIKVFH